VKGGHDEPTALQRTKARSEGPRKGPAFLTVLTGELVGTVYELTLGQTLIGRSEVAQVQLPDDGVSRRHAKIVRESDGSAKIVDLDSTNGTYINGRRVHAEGLREGDRIRIGQSATLDFRYEYRESGLIGVPPSRDTADVVVPVTRPSSDLLRGGYDNLAGAFDSLNKLSARQPPQDGRPVPQVAKASRPDTKPLPQAVTPAPQAAKHSPQAAKPAPQDPKQGQHDAAISTYRRTLQIRELKFGKDHPAVASILDSLGVSLQDAGEYEEALEQHQRALVIYEAQTRPPRETGHVLAHLGRCLLSLGQGIEALAQLERAHAMLRSHGASSAELARVRFAMAKALQHLDRDRDRMLDLARLARDAFAAGGTATREPYAEVRRWLQEHGEA
jgi:pSer/pThr/pTyr-binding forkhead associated (FHA) protein